MRTYTYVVKQYSTSNNSDVFVLVDRDCNTYVLTHDVFTDLINMLRAYSIERYDDAVIFADRVDGLLQDLHWLICDAARRFIYTVLSLVKDKRLFEAMPLCDDIIIPSIANEFESCEIFISTRHTRNTVSDISEDDFEPPSTDELIQLFQACA